MLRELDPRQNELLAALPDAIHRRILPQFQAVRLTVGQRLAGERDRHVYFPLSGIVSVDCALNSGATMAVGAVGRDGVVSVAPVLGAESFPFTHTVQCKSVVLRMPVAAFRKELAADDGFQRVMIRYALTLFGQLGHAAVCARFHTLEQQLSRWLLTCLDLLPTATVEMTQQRISHLLGCRREGVTEAAGKLQDAGLIIASRGRTTVIDRPRLETHACECYGLIHNYHRRAQAQAQPP